MTFLTAKEFGFYSIIAGSIGHLFGGWTGLLEIFFCAIIIDWFTGVAASLKEKQGLSSKVNFWGGFKKFLMILTVIFAHRIDLMLGLDWVMAGCIYFWLVNELISISENYARLGLPFPTPLRRLLSILKERPEHKGNILNKQSGK
ncbi:phage holin family protein [Paenibacillus sp. J5C_2022]|uniref:phage holin family protein n=1 Tax=Paenibacillus sp. J5C2022 TaxID=2977129 RepID=UPI0021D00483|nr:phage holin family protein [Paenibacillus sp. J5C2022]MCU6710089.1 phage holin family protein [Paenibacillus sp. J5C2022]